MMEYVGLDVSNEETSFCVKDCAGKVLASGKVASDPQALFEGLREHCLCPDTIVMETGSLSNWLARELLHLGLKVDVIDARQAHAVLRLQHNKTDANDAAVLADLARTGFCRQIHVKSDKASRMRVLLKARDHMVGQHRSRQNTIRGLLASLGHRLPKGAGKFARRVKAVLDNHRDLAVIFDPMLDEMAALQKSIEELDRAVAAAAKHSAACRLLMSAPGVGPVASVAFAATMDDPARFAKSRSVGAYLGLTSRRLQSGEMDYSGRISRHGDKMLRALLYGAANSFLSVVHRAHPLKDWARRVKRRSSHKKAVVALARKMAIILHRMLITGEAFRWPKENQKEAFSA